MLDLKIINGSCFINGKLEKQDRKLTTLEENQPEKLNGELNIRDLVGKVIGVDYPTKIYSKIKMRRVEL